MATLGAILDEMADQIRAQLVSVTDVDIQVEPRMVINASPPTIDMWPSDPSTDPDTAAHADLIGAEIITVRARVSTADSVAGQDLLLALMDDEDDLSILIALNDDPTLNGLGRLDVRNRSGYRLFPDPGGDGALLGCEWEVLVLKSHS